MDARVIVGGRNEVFDNLTSNCREARRKKDGSVLSSVPKASIDTTMTLAKAMQQKTPTAYLSLLGEWGTLPNWTGSAP